MIFNGLNKSYLFFILLFQVIFCAGFGNTSNAQSPTNYSILVAGHAYGAHAGKNIGLHPPFLEKLRINADTNVMAVFLTGDIVNQSNTASWTQVESELSSLQLKSYYVMGNHDNNSTGASVFQKKHGGTYYSFTFQNDLFIVLNSTESDRSISPVQLKFLDEVLTNTDSDWKRAFVFFHEVIWNSHEKYRLVRSNSRSRYALISGISNFWEQVYPKFTAIQNKSFYLFAGDVGGNPDAISASFDQWGHVFLLSSGMGEVKDENYLKVDISSDTVSFKLIPLNDDVQMHPVTWYNVPETPAQIDGSSRVNPAETTYKYEVSPVQNATVYRWDLSSGITGRSDSSAIDLRFDSDFQKGEISVTAIHDGFGESEPIALTIQSSAYTSVPEDTILPEISLNENQECIKLGFRSQTSGMAKLVIYDQAGRKIYIRNFSVDAGYNTRLIDKNKLTKGLVFIELLTGKTRMIQKKILN
ncbi:MAG: hypothetical protein WAO52_14795 [Prolixibacteraceae bacterium]